MSFLGEVRKPFKIVDQFHKSLSKWNLRLVAESSLCSANVCAAMADISGAGLIEDGFQVFSVCYVDEEVR